MLLLQPTSIVQFQRLIGIVPLGIGLTVIGFVWSQPYNGFGAIPVFFRIFASFIALAFVMIGGGALFGLTPRPGKQFEHDVDLGRRSSSDSPNNDPPTVPKNSDYECPSCAAPLTKNADVSPHGDVKCTHCGRWFNVHGR